MDYAVRRVTPTEWWEHRRLRLEGLKESPAAFGTRYDEALARPDEYWRTTTARGATGDAVASFVAVVDGAFVGMCTALLDTEITDTRCYQIVGVYVVPDYRGRSLGLSDALVTEVIRWARRDGGAERVRLFVTDSNERAAAFYRRSGFAETGHSLPYPNDPGVREIEMDFRGRR
jgi:ribosomal protein S18 acetylase RimI-like enzyme